MAYTFFIRQLTKRVWDVAMVGGGRQAMLVSGSIMCSWRRQLTARRLHEYSLAICLV